MPTLAGREERPCRRPRVPARIEWPGFGAHQPGGSQTEAAVDANWTYLLVPVVMIALWIGIQRYLDA